MSELSNILQRWTNRPLAKVTYLLGFLQNQKSPHRIGTITALVAELGNQNCFRQGNLD